MTTNTFYRFSTRLSSATFQASPVGLRARSEVDKGDALRLIGGDYGDIPFPVRFVQDAGRRMDDVLDTGYPSLFLVSGRFIEVLRENQLSGLADVPNNSSEPEVRTDSELRWVFCFWTVRPNYSRHGDYQADAR